MDFNLDNEVEDILFASILHYFNEFVAIIDMCPIDDAYGADLNCDLPNHPFLFELARCAEGVGHPHQRHPSNTGGLLSGGQKRLRKAQLSFCYIWHCGRNTAGRAGLSHGPS